MTLNDTTLNIDVIDGKLMVENTTVFSSEAISGIGYLHMIDGVISLDE